MARPVRETSDPFSRLLEVNVKPASFDSTAGSKDFDAPQASSLQKAEEGASGGNSREKLQEEEKEKEQTEKKVTIKEEAEEGDSEDKKSIKHEGREDLLKLPSTRRRRRRSTVVGPEHAGCYLIFDKTQVHAVRHIDLSVRLHLSSIYRKIRLPISQLSVYLLSLVELSSIYASTVLSFSISLLQSIYLSIHFQSPTFSPCLFDVSPVHFFFLHLFIYALSIISLSLSLSQSLSLFLILYEHRRMSVIPICVSYSFFSACIFLLFFLFVCFLFR